MSRQLSVLAIAPIGDETDAMASWHAYQWIARISRHARVTVLTMCNNGHITQGHLPNTEVIEWHEEIPSPRLDRLASMLKPAYPAFHAWVKGWVEAALAADKRFDIAHQFTPLDIRYPSPLADLDIPYILGPLAEALAVPAGFADECSSTSWVGRLRSMEQRRGRRDPALRRTYAGAAAVLVTSPCAGVPATSAGATRFEVASEVSVESLTPARATRDKGETLNLLYVGRPVRSSGLREAVRAIACLPEDVSVHLDVAGHGEEISMCRKEAELLGVSAKISFQGEPDTDSMMRMYERADALLFPGFCEPSGGHVFEALRHSLPVITVDRGGPGYIVDHSCGIKVPAVDPPQLAADLAEGITRLFRDPELLAQYSQGARERVARIGLWDNKIQRLLCLYAELVDAAQPLELKEVI